MIALAHMGFLGFEVCRSPASGCPCHSLSFARSSMASAKLFGLSEVHEEQPWGGGGGGWGGRTAGHQKFATDLPRLGSCVASYMLFSLRKGSGRFPRQPRQRTCQPLYPECPRQLKPIQPPDPQSYVVHHAPQTLKPKTPENKTQIKP